MDELDEKLNETFDGKVLRKDLLHRIKKGTNVPTFVLEFLLAKYCASNDPAELDAGMEAVLSSLQENYVRPDEANAAQSKVATKGKHRFIDKVHVRYVEKEKRHWASLENFNSQRIAIGEKYYRDNDRLLEGGIWAEVTLVHNDIDEDDYAFSIEDLRPIQLTRTVAFDEVGGIKVRDPDTIQIMKDFMANGRFSRGAEVIADASLSFVGNIDVSVRQVVNSNEHDLFQPLPPELDLAVMGRFAAYIPGWEMPKNSSEFLTRRYGLITDYLAEAFHYQFKHTNRYEEVSKRIRLGKSIEERDEKGIKKTVCAFLKILHPHGPPTDDEFEEYVAYATECRRRVKEQMNKRKPDDEFALINLSYFKASGEEVVVFCPESKEVAATQKPARRRLSPASEQPSGAIEAQPAVQPAPAVAVEPSVVPSPMAPVAAVVASPPAELKGRHFSILYGDTGYSYESILGPYLQGAKTAVIEEPYIRLHHQIQNFVRFCETVLKAGTVKKFA